MRFLQNNRVCQGREKKVGFVILDYFLTIPDFERFPNKKVGAIRLNASFFDSKRLLCSRLQPARTWVQRLIQDDYR